MAVNYTTKYESKIAERFQKKSITNSACGNEYSFVGAKTIRIQSVNTAPEQPYDRNRASNRFGDPTNLGDTMQEMTVTQQPAFTFVIEPLDNSDQAIEKAAGKALRRQLDEVTVPGMDKYRLKRWVEGSNIQNLLSATPNKTNIVESIIDTNARMTDALVPLENRTLYIPTQIYKLLKQNPDFISVETLGKEALTRGVVGEVDGCRVIPVPKGYLPDGVLFFIKYKGSTVDPVKMAKYEVIKQVQGYAGPVVQGVTYYDSFVLGTKGDGLAVCGTSSLILSAPTITLSGAKASITASDGITYRYTTDGTNPRYSATANIYTAAVTLEAGQTIRAIPIKEGCVGQEAQELYAG